MQTPTPDTTAAPPELLADATHRFVIPGSIDVLDLTFGPHDGSLYVAVNAEAIAPRAVAFSAWPEIAGIVAVVILLVLGLVILRIAKRPRKRGGSYCAKCNYCVTDAEYERCPECGRALTASSIRSGRLMPVRLAIPLALAVVVVAVGVVLAIWGPSRRAAWMMTAGPHWSIELADKARTDQIARLTPFIQKGTQIVRVNPVTGGIEPISFIPKPFAAGISYDLRFNNDGSALVLRSRGGGLVAIDGGSGHQIAELEDPEYITDPRREWPTIAGYSADGDVAYVVRLAHAAGETRLIAWDFRRNEARVLHSIPTESYQAAHGEMRFARRYRSYTTDDGVRFLRYPSDYGVNRNNLDRALSTIELVDESGDVLAGQQAPIDSTESPQVAPGGRTFVQGSLPRARQMELFAFKDLETVEHARIPLHSGRNLRLIANGRLLVAGTHDSALVFRSASTLKHLGVVQGPEDLILSDMDSNQAGTHLAVIGFKETAPGSKQYRREILLFDLSDRPWLGDGAESSASE